MHYFDEKDPNEHLEATFGALANLNPVFKEYKSKSLAVEVLDVLGWGSLDQFNEDLASLLPAA